jgi:hypothetical protein
MARPTLSRRAPNVTLVTLSPYSSELNLVERVWIYLRETYLSLCLLDNYDAIVDGRAARPGAGSSQTASAHSRITPTSKGSTDRLGCIIRNVISKSIYHEMDYKPRIAEMEKFIREISYVM